MVRSTLSFRKHHTYDVKVGSNPLLPKTSCARTVRIILPAAHAVGNIPFANRALPCNVWECPHYPPAWQGIYPPHRKGDKRQVPGDRWCQATGGARRQVHSSAHPLLRSSAPPLLRSSAPPLLRSSAPPLLRSSAPPLLRSPAPPSSVQFILVSLLPRPQRIAR
jgi:hypothetical protein